MYARSFLARCAVALPFVLAGLGPEVAQAATWQCSVGNPIFGASYVERFIVDDGAARGDVVFARGAPSRKPFRVLRNDGHTLMAISQHSETVGGKVRVFDDTITIEKRDGSILQVTTSYGPHLGPWTDGVTGSCAYLP